MTPDNTRIYVVNETNGPSHLVRAATPAQAIRHIVSDRFIAEVASQQQLVDLLGKGAKVREPHPRNPDPAQAVRLGNWADF